MPSPCEECVMERLVDGEWIIIGEFQEDGMASGLSSEILIGQKCSLRLTCGGATNIMWSIPGAPIKDYQPSTGQTSQVELTAADRAGTSIEFYWTVEGPKEIEVFFNIGQEECSVKGGVRVLVPSCTTSRPTGPTDIGEAIGLGPQAGIALKTGVNADPGITFAAQVQTPEGFGGDGEWQFAQLVLPILYANNTYYDIGVKKHVFTFIPGPYYLFRLDKSFGFNNGDTDDPPYSAPVNNPQTFTAKDSPSIGADPTFFKRADSKRDYFMFIMYKPPNRDGASIWVPLKRLNWRFQFCAESSQAAWNFKTQNSTAGTGWINWSVEPSWLGLVQPTSATTMTVQHIPNCP